MMSGRLAGGKGLPVGLPLALCHHGRFWQSCEYLLRGTLLGSPTFSSQCWPGDQLLTGSLYCRRERKMEEVRPPAACSWPGLRIGCAGAASLMLCRVLCMAVLGMHAPFAEHSLQGPFS